MTVNLSMMRNTVRKMTARYTPQQMTDAQIDQYMNLFMTLMLPEHFKNIKLTKPYVFTTIPNVDTYQFPYEANPIEPETGNTTTVSPGNIQITPPVRCQGYLLRYFQDKTNFYNRWPNISVNQQIGNGNGTPNFTYTGTIPSTPFYRAQLDIFGNVTEAAVIISAFDSGTSSNTNYVLTDEPQDDSDVGILVESDGTNIGHINYLTGTYDFKPSNSAALPKTTNIFAAVVPYQASRPVDILFYNQQIVLRPCPAQIYQIEFQISQQPTALILDNSAPELNEWYLFICAGAAKLIYTDFPDDEGMAYVMPIFQEQLQLANRRTLKQLNTQRAQTIFSAPGRPLASWFYGTEYSGN